jgi:hypothetical protein
VDSQNSIKKEELALALLNHGPNYKDIYDFSSRLAGNFVIFYAHGQEIYVFGDAMHSIPIYYGYDEKDWVIGSVPHLVAGYFNYGFSAESMAIRRGSENYSQPLPGDITNYDNIKILLPNHILDLKRRQVMRVPLKIVSLKSSEDTIAASAELIDNITKAFSEKYSFACPLTAGADSRLILSFLQRNLGDVPIYTFRHNYAPWHSDLVIPQIICRRQGKVHLMIEDLKAPEAYHAALEEIIGPYYDRGTVDLAYTLRKNFSINTAIINGDIIGHIGNNYIGGGLRPNYCNAFYILCKIHNYEILAKKEVEKWLQDACSLGENEYLFDLFNLENRMGRWANQGGNLYALCGVNRVNIFNSRDVIAYWLGVPAAERTKNIIHNELLKRNDPELLTLPANPGHLANIATKSPYLFLAGTYAKYAYGRIKHFMQK